VYHEDLKNLHGNLLSHTTLWMQIHGNNEIELNVSALNTIAALSLPVEEDLLQKLIHPFIKDSDNIENLTPRQLRNLFEAFVYIELSLKIKIKISLPSIDAYLSEKAHDHYPTISFAQKYIYEQINSFLLPQYQEELSQEHLVGPYRLDLAIPSKKIAFETDGVHHHKLNRLRSKDQLRDWVLKKYYNYTVFRFSKVSLNNQFDLIQALLPIAELLKPEVYTAENKKLLPQNKAVLKQDLIPCPQDPVNPSPQMQRFYFSNKSPSARMQKKFIAGRSAVFVDQNRLFCLVKSSDSELPLKKFSILLKQIPIKRLLTLWNTNVFPGKTLPQIMQNKVTPEKLESLETYITKKLRSVPRLKKDSSLRHAGFYRKKLRPFVFPKAPSLKMQKKFTACHSSIATDQNRLLCFIYSSQSELPLKKFDTMLKKVGADRLHMLWNTSTSFGKPLSQRSRYKMKAKKVKCLISNMAMDLAISSALNQEVTPPQKRTAHSIKKIVQKPSISEVPQDLDKFTHVSDLSSPSSLNKSSNTVPHKPINMNIPMQIQPLPISRKISSNMRKSFVTGKSDIAVDQNRLIRFLASSNSQLSLKNFNKLLKKTSTERLRILWDTNTPSGEPLSQVSQDKMEPGKLNSLKSRLGVNLTAPASSNRYSMFSAVNSAKSVQQPLVTKSVQPPPATKSVPQAPVIKPIQQRFTSNQSSSSSLQPLPSGPMQINWNNAQRKFMTSQDSIETDQKRLVSFLRMSDKQFPLHHFSLLLERVNINRLRSLCEKNISNGKSLLQEKPKKVVQGKWYRLQKRITDNSAVFASPGVAALSTSICIFSATSPSSTLSNQSSSSLHPVARKNTLI
jgi:very-short-patch-repair endonuclease